MAVLYVVATPIGNLQDFSPRAVETLRGADLIAAEDTRTAMKLCQIYDLHARLISCHCRNEKEKSVRIAEMIMKEDLCCALTTDAGTPCISDPGHELVHACVERGIPVLPIPGCCAAVSAVSVSGFDAREFSFYGFLPREKKELREKLTQISRGTPVAVVHESPFRVIELIENIAEVVPEAQLSVCCDLTKMHEKTVYGAPEDVLLNLKNNPKAEKGEYCIVMDFHGTDAEKEQKAEAAEGSVESRLVEEMLKGLSLREAQDAVAACGIRKNLVKQAALALKRLFAEEA